MTHRRVILFIVFALAFYLLKQAPNFLDSHLAVDRTWHPSGQPTLPQFPALPPPQELYGGVEFYDVTISGTGPALPMRVLVYLPKGRHVAKSLPCVFIAPAGSYCWGMHLDPNDMPEHTPYAQEGFAVVAYEVSGALSPEADKTKQYSDILPSTREFVNTDGGLINGKVAINFALNKIPEVNPDALFACGHSSAGMQALNLCREDSRIRACCAYAPSIDVVTWWNNPTLARHIPELPSFAARKSPLCHVNELNKPIYLLHADDDSRVPLATTLQFVSEMQAAKKSITFERVPTGDHYQPMIDIGIPHGILFLREHGATPLEPIR